LLRSASCLAKLDRVKKALAHREPDRVPVSDFFWGTFLQRWRDEYGLPADADVYKYFDLDWRTVVPNMDPHIKPFEIIRQDDREVVARTGFEAVLRKQFADPMPAFLSFATDTVEKMMAFRFDDPADPRRYLSAGDNQLAGLGDTFERNTPAFVDTVRALHPDFPVFGQVCEAMEIMGRTISPEQVLLWIGLYPDEVGRFIARIGDYVAGIAEAQILACGGMLDGMVMWGDIAYRNDMLFSPRYWRKHFEPVVRRLAAIGHAHGLPVIYHSCGNTRRVFGDLIDAGIDGYNPLEAKAGMDAVELRRQYGHRIAFVGNMDVQVWSSGDREAMTRAALRLLNAGRGGGLIFQSDHSVPGNIAPADYELVVNLVRAKGVYPLKLGEFEEVL
jgi:uroporphyrinogen decarboxylase